MNRNKDNKLKSNKVLELPTLTHNAVNIDYIINKFSLDSFKVRIPLDDVTILDSNISAHFYLVNTETGEVDEEDFQRTAKWYDNGFGVKVKIGVEHQTSVKGSIRKFAVLLLSSKILKNKYFEGVTQTNVRLVYDYIMSLKVIDFNYDSFMSGDVTDCDIKRDVKCNMIDFEILKNLAKKYAKSSVSFGSGYRSFWTKKNKGFQFSDRKTTAFRTQPYFKVYHKPTELINRSSAFANKYLKGLDYTNLIRYECTIKNRDHFEYLFGFRDNSLTAYLGLSQNQYKIVQRKAFEKHFLFMKSTDKRLVGVSPTDIVFYNLIDYLILNESLSVEQILSICLDSIISPVARSRMKGKLRRIIHELTIMSIVSKEKLTENNRSYDWFKQQFDIQGDLFNKKGYDKS